MNTHTTNHVDFHNIVTSAEAMNIIETSARTLMASPEMAFELPSIILRGAPGVGKSTIVREVAKKLGIEFVDVRLAQLERVDICGLPSVKDGQTTWNVPAFWPKDKNSAGIIFFDEITAAPSDCQVAAYSMILDRKIPNTDYELPGKWLIVAAGNRSVDHAVAKPMSSALANRFMHFELEADPESWVEWAVQHDIDPSITGFIRYRPQNLFRMDNQNLEQGWPTPRSWEKVSNMLKLFKNNDEVLSKIVWGLVGQGVGVEFMAFNKTARKFDNVLDVMLNPKAKIEIPTKADERYAYVAAAAYLIWQGKSEDDTKKRVDGMYRIAMELTSDFASLLVKLCMVGNSRVSKLEAVSKIMKSPHFKAFSDKFGSAFTKKHTLN